MDAIDRIEVYQMRLELVPISWNDIATHQRVSRSTLFRWRQSNKYVDPLVRREIDAIDRIKVDQMRSESVPISWTDIATDQRVSVSTLSRWIQYNNYVDPLVRH